MTTLKKKSFKGLREKEELLVTSISSFPTVFSTILKTNFNFSVTFILSSTSAFNLDQSEKSLFGKNRLTVKLLLVIKVHNSSPNKEKVDLLKS